MKKKILIVDDEPLMQEFLLEALERRNPYKVELAENGKEALKKIKEKPYQLVISDIRMPDVSGMELLKEAKTIDPGIGIILITAYGTVQLAVQAMKHGAFDFITKPLNIDQIEMVVSKFFKFKELEYENTYLKDEINRQFGFASIIGRSEKMKRIFEIVEMVARSKATVLIQGASGTGKELIAKAIHYNSDRRDKPFVKTNCAALPDGLIESELFGHEKGAFTGAIRAAKGRFELADSGTLLLDEISEMSLSLQVKLLRVLQEKEFEKVGNPETFQVDVRIVATTNRDLKEEVRQGNFREDLYYRLNVVPIELPTLRERKEDIPLLVEHFIQKYAKDNHKNITGIDKEALEFLMKYNWPGNVRELENTIERASVISKEQVLKLQHFLTFNAFEKDWQGGNNAWEGNTKNLREIERRKILEVLNETGGNRTRAAVELGISVRTLRNKLKEFRENGIEIPS
ncbi:MAG TPA: sigma-54-dependent Fis family transcriptional regulator [Bacteroidetes bacterium]|nr:transcriptional regulatory protein ZraR [bacterium BMS3Bbin03]HDK35372.1 sigma-54-dependent Fis family transcriptional regulator [Bacteroidota bacterium]HDL77983.1 sigma-54-dependent Fis family transcriptional regulator [Bacteroidota bacterium]